MQLLTIRKQKNLQVPPNIHLEFFYSQSNLLNFVLKINFLFRFVTFAKVAYI